MSRTNSGETTSESERAHPLIDGGIYYRNADNPVKLRLNGTSYCQTHPKGVRELLDLDLGAAPQIVVHPELNAVTYIYRDHDDEEEVRDGGR